MIIRYEMEPEGTALAFWFRWRRSALFKLGVFAVGLIPAMFAFALAYSALPRRPGLALLIAVVVDACSPFAFPKLLTSLAKRGERILSIDADGISTRVPTGDWQVTWRHVQQIATTGDFVLLLGVGINSVAIPNRAFEDLEQRDEFLRRAERYLKAARPGEVG
jgi:hypothetical protein